MTKRIDDIADTSAEFDDMLGVQNVEQSGTLHQFLGESITPENEQEAAKMFMTPHDIARQEWVGMPEFVAEAPAPDINIKISFRSEEDKLAFGELIGQKISAKTKSAWWPEREPDQNSLKRYIESLEDNNAD